MNTVAAWGNVPIEAEVNVGVVLGAEVGAGDDCGRGVGGAGVSVAIVPQATAPTITVANTALRTVACNIDIPGF